MAESMVIEGKSLEELEREITCGICQEHYTEPKILPCLHYYCKQCVLRLATRTGVTKPFFCPECRREAILPEGGVDELKTAFFINRLTTTVSTMEQAHGKVEVKCELCSDSEDNAEAFCRQCAMFICKECIRQHKRLKTYLTHEVTSLEDLKQRQKKATMVKQSSTKLCSDHKEPLIIYCFDCENLICRDCTVKDHRNHNFEFSKKAAPDVIQDLSKKLEFLKDQITLLSQGIQKIHTVKQQLKADSHAMSSNIKTSFKKLRDTLDEREQKLLEEAAGQVQEKMEKLSAQEKNLFVASAEAQSVVDYTEQCVRHCTDNEVMSMHTEIRRQIEQKIEEHSKSERSLEPEEEADIGVEVRCEEAFQQLIQTQANIIQLPADPTKCTVTMDDMKHAVKKTSKATLVIRLSNNTISRRHHKVSCSLWSLYNNIRTQCKVDVTGEGQYFIKYISTVRGRHKLTVSVDGQQVAGSPFSVFVFIHPIQLGKPVKVWNNITNPTGIAVTSTGDIIVAEVHGNIVKVNKERTETIVEDQNNFHIHKLEVTDDHIYCINEKSNEILRCSLSGDNIRIHEVRQISKQRGLAIVGDEVMLCPKDTGGTIMIYDKELKYVRCIKHQDECRLLAMSSDCHGNLHCADWENNCVLVLSIDGVFLHSFSCDEKGEKKVKRPWGLCVSGDYVYVCNASIYNVSVFTTDGVYVTSFGQYGSNEGDFNFPHSVCVDEDRFVYVTDYLNHRVQCF